MAMLGQPVGPTFDFDKPRNRARLDCRAVSVLKSLQANVNA